MNKEFLRMWSKAFIEDIQDKFVIEVHLTLGEVDKSLPGIMYTRESVGGTRSKYIALAGYDDDVSLLTGRDIENKTINAPVELLDARGRTWHVGAWAFSRNFKDRGWERNVPYDDGCQSYVILVLSNSRRYGEYRLGSISINFIEAL